MQPASGLLDLLPVELTAHSGHRQSVELFERSNPESLCAAPFTSPDFKTGENTKQINELALMGGKYWVLNAYFLQ